MTDIIIPWERTVFLPEGSPAISCINNITVELRPGPAGSDGEGMYCLAEADILIEYQSMPPPSSGGAFARASAQPGSSWQALLTLPLELKAAASPPEQPDITVSGLNWFMVSGRAVELEAVLHISDQMAQMSSAPWGEKKESGEWTMVSLQEQQGGAVNSGEDWERENIDGKEGSERVIERDSIYGTGRERAGMAGESAAEWQFQRQIADLTAQAGQTAQQCCRLWEQYEQQQDEVEVEVEVEGGEQWIEESVVSGAGSAEGERGEHRIVREAGTEQAAGIFEQEKESSIEREKIDNTEESERVIERAEERIIDAVEQSGNEGDDRAREIEEAGDGVAVDAAEGALSAAPPGPEIAAAVEDNAPVEEAASGGADIVEEAASGGADIVEEAASGGADIVEEAVEEAAEAVGEAVREAGDLAEGQLRAAIEAALAGQTAEQQGAPPDALAAALAQATTALAEAMAAAEAGQSSPAALAEVAAALQAAADEAAAAGLDGLDEVAEALGGAEPETPAAPMAQQRFKLVFGSQPAASSVTQIAEFVDEAAPKAAPEAALTEETAPVETLTEALMEAGTLTEEGAEALSPAPPDLAAATGGELSAVETEAEVLPKPRRRLSGLPRLNVDAKDNNIEINAFNLNIKL